MSRPAAWSVVVWPIGLKLVLDFFVPARDLDFALFNGALFVAVVGLRVPLKMNWRVFAAISGVTLFFLAELLRNPSETIGYKLLTMPLLAILFYNAGRSMSREALCRAFNVLLALFVLCFCGNYLLSAFLGNLASREFWNFEHANLLGSYVLIMLIPINYIATEGGRRHGMTLVKVIFVGIAFLTTSTGALVLMLPALIREWKASVTRLVLMVTSACVVGVCAVVVLYLFDKPTYDKLAAPFLLISGGGWNQLVQSARGASGITHFASDQQGSFTWRIYADLVYGFFLANEGVVRLLTGNGIGGFAQVWNGAMPHNDFILLLIDFGAPFLILTVAYLLRLFRHVARHEPQWRIVVLILVVRLAFENNIYSYYVLSSGVIFSALVIGALSRREAVPQAARSQAAGWSGELGWRRS
ncbi:hypothetical protein ACFQ3P_42070 [Paraburkholderia sabiae]|uniref:O-antigen ligase domain-containing protein n=1 Tax=Paraburkholderia sabiae TaxID=273251 RepID=A0ABU9QS26_9BURK|nr:hypothetical protein [Paraburkholderia sabiae]WJZ79600.1 hypothetical protein QEN71_40700 [Paraburkholderia sabiae]CAD6563107.1 hypothetical protein LMG24235_08349 [Paraburkholderia sabiae]